ncbi:MAG: ORC1-type DNA replication protein [Candidatus Heimdallarchaeota archaeon]|nr:ORC1-type DNA replication protein [Candidatus Heimdallarchaeota archaeon]
MDRILEEELKKPSLIKNPRVLDLKYIPKKLLHREEEQKMLIQYFKPVIEHPGTYSQRVSIVGAIGTGKTAIALKFGEMIKVYSTQKNLNLKYVHINCRRARSSFLTLLEIVRKFNPHIPVRGFSPEEILKMLTEILNRKNLFLVVTLDEIDFVIRRDGPNILYDLTRLTDEEIDKKERVSIITIVRDIAFRTMLDESTLSTLRQNIISLDPYTEDQLLDIITDRTEQAFFEDTVSKEALALIADIASQNGDARYAIELLERAGMYADHKQSLRVLPEHVRYANASIHPVIRQEIIKDINSQQKITLLAIARKLKTTQKAYATMGEVEEIYQTLCEEFQLPTRSHTQLWEYIQYLQNCDVITTRLSSKGQRGQTTLISLPDVSAEIIEKTIKEQLKKERE